MDMLTRMRKAAERVENVKRILTSVKSAELENSFTARTHSMLARDFKKNAETLHCLYDSRYFCLNANRQTLEKISSHFKKFLSLDSSTFIECVRNYIATSHGHGTIKEIRNDYDNVFASTSSMLESAYRYKIGLRMEPLHSHCGCNVAMMAAILLFFKFRIRIIHFLSMNPSKDDGDIFLGHVLLEVFNNEKNSWEIHDPDFDCGYGIIKNGLLKKASSADFLCADPKNIFAIYSSENFDWGNLLHEDDRKNQILRRQFLHDMITNDNFFKNYSDVITINYSCRGATCILNLDNIDIERRYAGCGDRTVIEHLNTIFNSPVMLGRRRKKLIMLSPNLKI